MTRQAEDGSGVHALCHRLDEIIRNRAPAWRTAYIDAAIEEIPAETRRLSPRCARRAVRSRRRDCHSVDSQGGDATIPGLSQSTQECARVIALANHHLSLRPDFQLWRSELSYQHDRAIVDGSKVQLWSASTRSICRGTPGFQRSHTAKEAGASVRRRAEFKPTPRLVSDGLGGPTSDCTRLTRHRTWTFMGT